MAHPYLLAACAAISLSLCRLASAYSGDIDMGSPVERGSPALPIMMQLESTPATTTALEAPSASDSKQSQPRPVRDTPAQSRGDAFQRYFDQHYRAHLVLDAAAHRDSKVE